MTRRLSERRTSPTARDERGAVMVLVAVTLPVIFLFVAFGVEVGHWYDYSRNLQNRADAAALAAGDAYGATCFGTNPTSAQTDVIGKTAQQYAGPPPGTLDANLPYGYTLPAAFQPYQNQPNLTKGAPANFHMLLNSTAYWNNGGTNWSMESAAQRTADPAPPSSLAICGSTDEDGKTGPMVDVRLTQANIGLFFPFFGFTPTISAHARVGLQGVGAENNIIPLAVRDPAEERCVQANFFNDSTGAQIASVNLAKKGTDPTTGAVQWDNSANPVSVSIPSSANVYEQIVTGYCDQNASTYGANSGLLYINSYGNSTPNSGQAPVITTGGVALTGPCPSAADKLANQYFTDETCSVGVTAHVAFAPNVPYTGPAGPQQVKATDTSGQGGGPLQLSKLSTQVNGNQNNIPAGGLLQVNSTAGFAASGSITDNGGSNGNGPVNTFAYTAIDATHFKLTNGGSFGNNDFITQTGDTTWTSSGAFTVNPGTPAVGVGQHPISISATQKFGSIGGTNCSTGNGCTTNFGVQQQTFGVCNDGDPTLTCNDPNDSGPIVLAQLRTSADSAGTWASDITQTYGENAFAGGSAQQLIATVEIAGLSNAKPGDPPTTLRFDEQASGTDHATGLVNCGQGNGASADLAALMSTCPLVGTNACKDTMFCAPLAINERPVSNPAPCNPEGNDLGGTVVARPNTNTLTSAPVPVDCTGTGPGNKTPIVAGVACRIITAGCKPNGFPNGDVCSSNNWSPTEGAASIPAADPRAITVIITAPSDLAKNNSGQIIPIENFAVFYVTGWAGKGNGGKNPSCNSYAAPPPGASLDAENVNECPDGSLDSGGKKGCADTLSETIWGHWIKYTNVGAESSGSPCNLGAFGNCVPVLTR